MLFGSFLIKEESVNFILVRLFDFKLKFLVERLEKLRWQMYLIKIAQRSSLNH